MQKRLKSAIWPVKATVSQPSSEKVSPLVRLEQLRAAMPLAGYIRQAGLIPGILPISSATLWRWVKAKEFPEPVKLSPRVTGWRVAEVEAWIRKHGTT